MELHFIFMQKRILVILTLFVISIFLVVGCQQNANVNEKYDCIDNDCAFKNIGECVKEFSVFSKPTGLGYNLRLLDESSVSETSKTCIYEYTLIQDENQDKSHIGETSICNYNLSKSGGSIIDISCSGVLYPYIAEKTSQSTVV